MTAPSIKEALEPVLSFLDELAANAVSGKRQALNPIVIGGSAKLYAEGLRAALATLQPSGERREAIARALTAAKLLLQNSIECAAKHHNLHPDTDPRSGWLGHCEDDIKEADRILASGLVQDEAGIRADEREKCAKIADREAEFWQDAESSSARIVAAAIRSARDGGAET